MSGLPAASVVVCTRERPLHLRACLDALRRVTYPSFHIIVVDNGVQDGRTQSVARDFGARYVAQPVGGLSCARNAGLAAAETDIVAFLDDDALAQPAWLKALVDEFGDGRVMAVSGRVVPVAGQAESEDAGRLRGSYRGGGQRRWVSRQTDDWFALANFGGLGIGANMALRRSAMTWWKGFDERLGRGAPLMAGEETYAFASILKAGYAVVYTPDAVVEHPFAPPDDDIVPRRLQSRSALTAYATFLLMEEPRQASQVLRYLLRRVFRRPIEWREQVPRGDAAIPAWRAALAALYGPILYFRARNAR